MEHFDSQTVRFESSVILYGSKTLKDLERKEIMFESSVILYGSKTASNKLRRSDGV